jgi:hypothetical protein
MLAEDPTGCVSSAGSLFTENNMKKITCLSLLVAGALALSLQQAVAAGSGFIENMPQLTEYPDGAMRWEKPGLDQETYTRVMIEPITIFISPDSEYKGLKPDELKVIADGLMVAITNTLEPEVPVINQAGQGVIYFRIALSDVKLAKKKRGLLGYTPIGFVVTAAVDSAGGNISLKNAEIEIEALDSVSGKRLGVVVDKAPTVDPDEKLSWDSINHTMVHFAERFKQRMSAAKPQGDATAP